MPRAGRLVTEKFARQVVPLVQSAPARRATRQKLPSVMQQLPLDYQGPTVAPPDNGRSTVGRVLAASSLALPFLGILLVMALPAITGENPSNIDRLVLLLPLFASMGVGVIALCGIPWWGERGVWVPAVLGISVSVFGFLMTQYG